MTETYAAKCPKCRHAQAVEIRDKGKFRLRCRRCRRQTKLIQFPYDGKPPFEACLIKGPFALDVTPKAVAAWNLRTFGPKLRQLQDIPDKHTEAKDGRD